MFYNMYICNRFGMRVEMTGSDESIICRFQKNLEAIRKVAGWTSQELADEIGVTRQTISNLESSRSKMTKTQYLALRTVLNFEIIQNDNRALATVVKSLVDDMELPEGYEAFLDPDSKSKDKRIKNATIMGLSMLTAAAAGSIGALGLLSSLTSLWKK